MTHSFSLSFYYFIYYFLSSPEDMLIDFRERVQEGEKEGEKY